MTILQLLVLVLLVMSIVVLTLTKGAKEWVALTLVAVILALEHLRYWLR